MPVFGNFDKTMGVVKSYAKINLALDVLGRDGDYHLIDTIMTEVPGLFDEIEITESGELIVEMNGVPQEENLAYKAAKLLGAKAHIRIKKNIPMASGLGGGSSNAAAVLKALGCDNLDLAARLGMDVPFFMVGGTCRCTHYGEMVEKIETDLEISPNIIIRTGKKSTANAYSLLNLSLCGQDRDKTEQMAQALRENNLEGVKKNLHNDFEQLYNLEKGEHLTGSGPTRFEIG